MLAKIPVGLLMPRMEFGWNYRALFKGITFMLRTEFETEFMFWFERGNVTPNRDFPFHASSHEVIVFASEGKQDRMALPLPRALA